MQIISKKSYKFRQIWLIICLTVTPLAIKAENANPKLDLIDQKAIKKNHNNEYEVKKGDTLWNVANHFLNKPWEWQKIWKVNPQIQNPHLIFPGDIIQLSYKNGSPQLMITKRGDTAHTIKLSPKIRVMPFENAIPTIPAKKIEVFLRKNVIYQSEALQHRPYVVAMGSERIMAVKDDVIYAVGNIEGTQFNVFRKNDHITHPKTNEKLGVMMDWIANVRLADKQGEIYKLSINKATQGVKKGDILIPVTNDNPKMYFYPKAPLKKISGTVIKNMTANLRSGKNDTVLIDLGKNQGIEAGDIIVIKRDLKRIAIDPKTEKKIPIPPETMGTAMIYKVYDNLSYALVMHAKQGIEISDIVVNP